MELQTVNADGPFVLRVDASGRAMGAALEQSVDAAGPGSTDGVATLTVVEPGTAFPARGRVRLFDNDIRGNKGGNYRLDL